jgi:hypothetical protein
VAKLGLSKVIPFVSDDLNMEKDCFGGRSQNFMFKKFGHLTFENCTFGELL